MARATSQSDGVLPRIDFAAELEHCPDCGAATRVAKSRRRTVATIAYGEFEARELLKHCPRCVSAPLHGCAALQRIVGPRQRFGYDLIVHVGLARYLRGMQRDEIRDELRRDHGIEPSSGTISVLCDRFLSYLESLHLLRSPYLRAAMVGGYPLHLDATCDRGKGGLLVCLDGWRGWVLMAARIDTENPLQMGPVVSSNLISDGHDALLKHDIRGRGPNINNLRHLLTRCATPQNAHAKPLTLLRLDRFVQTANRRSMVIAVFEGCGGLTVPMLTQGVVSMRLR